MKKRLLCGVLACFLLGLLVSYVELKQAEIIPPDPMTSPKEVIEFITPRPEKTQYV